MSAKVLIGTGEFGESLEVYYCLFRLREGGFEPVVAAPTKKTIQLVVHDFDPQYEGYTEKPGYRIEADISYADVRPEDYAGLILPGGRAPEEIRSNPGLLHAVRHFLASDKPIGALCHGVMILYTAGSIEGAEVTCYAGIRPDVEMADGIYVDRNVVVSGSLVTSRGWGDLDAFCREFLKLLHSPAG